MFILSLAQETSCKHFLQIKTPKPRHLMLRTLSLTDRQCNARAVPSFLLFWIQHSFDYIDPEPASSHMAARSLLWLQLGHQSFSDIIVVLLLWGCPAALKESCLRRILAYGFICQQHSFISFRAEAPLCNQLHATNKSYPFTYNVLSISDGHLDTACSVA